MKRKILLSIFLIFTLTFSLFALASCNDGNGGKQVPVYQGMTITKAGTTLGFRTASDKSNKNNGNHYGHYKGDHSDRNEAIDEENPYPDNETNENIEEEIKSSLNVIGSPDEIYYATPNEDIYINIHIDNPDSFEIMSFTLNGKKYSSYMFEEGSDMETIVLKYNVGDAAGIVAYTIDAIKYIDGTEIKDVIIDGSKTVMAGIKTQNQVAASITGVDIDTNALSFHVNVKDNNALIEFSGGALKALIYDGFQIVSEKDIALGDNSVIFDGLKTNTLYQYAIVGYYDDLSGNGFGMHVLYKDAFYTNAVVLFDNITVGKEAIRFGYLWHEDHQGKAISALKLYKGDAFEKDLAASTTALNDLLSDTTYKLVAEYSNADKTESITLEFTTLAKATPEIELTAPTKTQTSVGFTITETDADNVGAVTKIELVHASGTVIADSLDQRSFANLLSNNAYTVKVTYVYDLNDGNGAQTIVKELSIATLAKATPEIELTAPTKTQTSVGFTITETDADNVGAVTKIELVHASGTVIADSLDQRSFANLLSNNAYTVKVTYVYDLNDGNGAQTIAKELSIATLAKAAPSFAPKDESITMNSIQAAYDITDTDGILLSYKVALYKGADLIAEHAEKKISFASLNYYTNYTLKITYTYDLNDGNGIQTAVFEKAYTTLPYIDVTDCNIANTSAVSEGETIYMSVSLENPLGMTVESVVINGETYSVTGASTKNRIFVEIVYNGQFAGGDTYLKVDTVNAKIGEASRAIEPESELSDNVFIYGKLEVLKIEIVNEDFEPIEWAFPSETLYALITLNNPTGYNLDTVDDSITGLTKIDDDHWYYEVYDAYSGQHNISLYSLSYSLGDFSKSATCSGLSAPYLRLSSDTVHYISRADDLKNMRDGYYYELTNDIDLAGMEWKGSGFSGVFNGNGYAIKNLSFVGTITNQNAYLGLFSTGEGFIQNLRIENMTIIADVVSDNGNVYEIYAGGLVARSSADLHIYGCSVDEYSVISVKNETTVSEFEETGAGGLIGYADVFCTVAIKNSTNRAGISAATNGYSSACAGGLVGNGYVGYGCPTVTIENSTNSGSISATSESLNACAGGLVGYAHNATITESTNSGSISATAESRYAYAGGLVGYTSNATITDSTNSGNVSATSENYNAYAGGLVGYAYNATITDSTNSSNVSAISEGYAYAGGLVGNTINATITDSTNSGNVSATAENNSAYAGDLVGYIGA